MKTSGDTQVREYDNDNVGRIALFGLLLVLSLIVGAVKLVAQQMPSSNAAIRPFVGAYLPTGDQRDFLKDAVLVGAQASWSAMPQLALTGSFGWAPSKDKITPGDQTIDAFQYDVGAEVKAPTTVGLVTPFIGAGIGGRTYSYRDLNVDTKTNVDGYGALGLDASVDILSARIEARDYVSRFKPLTGGGDTKTRNDVALFAAIGVRF